MKLSIRNVLRLIWVLAGLGFISWNFISYQPHNLDPNTFVSTNAIQVSQTDNWIAFQAKTAKKPVLIFFPGAMVDPKVYAPLARHIAEAGYSTYIIKMPWRMASYGYQRINDLFNFADTTKQYVLCGHSQGGKMAAQFVYEHPGKMAGLILIGTSHPRDIDLSTTTIPVMKLCATNDGLASLREVNQNKIKLPAKTEYVQIQGGNHAQFGYYGSQLGDDEATISRSEQQILSEQAILRFLRKI
ncbi:alpha/beta hydrolase [Spirosoma harenae]